MVSETVTDNKLCQIFMNSHQRKREKTCLLKCFISPEEHRITFLLQVLLNVHQTMATTTRKRFKLEEKSSTIVFLLQILPNLFESFLTSPRTRKSELFPHPFGPQTRTFVPDRT